MMLLYPHERNPGYVTNPSPTSTDAESIDRNLAFQHQQGFIGGQTDSIIGLT